MEGDLEQVVGLERNQFTVIQAIEPFIKQEDISSDYEGDNEEIGWLVEEHRCNIPRGADGNSSSDTASMESDYRGIDRQGSSSSSGRNTEQSHHVKMVEEQEGSNRILFTGREFTSYEEFQESVQIYERQEFCKLTVHNSRSVVAANKLIKPGCRLFDEKFRYSFIKLKCKHFGSFNSRSTGKRPNQRTYRTGCRMLFSASVDRVRNRLVIGEGCFVHNHEKSYQVFQSYPENKRLSKDEKLQAESKKDGAVPACVFQKKLQDISGKPITQRDINNLRPALTRDPQGDSHKLLLDSINGILSDDPTCNIMMFTKEGDISVVLLQTMSMRLALQKFPEVILCDATHKVSRNKMILYTFLIEDGNEKNIPCAHALIAGETKEAHKHVFQLLKESGGDDLQSTKLFLVDKDFTEVALLKETFPQADVHLYTSHVLGTFNRETRNLEQDKKEDVRTILQEMAKTRDEAEYDKLTGDLKESSTSKFFKYFSQEWHDCRDMWVPAFHRFPRQFGSSTTNRLEGFRQKLKTVITSYFTVAQCLDALVFLNKRLMGELTHSPVSPIIHADCKPLHVSKAIAEECTPYAANKLLRELCCSVKCIVVAGNRSETLNNSSTTMVTATVREGTVTHTVCNENGTLTCSCDFSTSVGLPCRHIFCYRDHMALPLYESALVSERWKKHYQLYTPSKQKVGHVSHVLVKDVHRHAITKTEKYKSSLAVSKQIARLLSDLSPACFQDRLQQLKQLLAFWVADRDVMIVEPAVLDDLWDVFKGDSSNSRAGQSSEVPEISETVELPESSSKSNDSSIPSLQNMGRATAEQSQLPLSDVPNRRVQGESSDKAQTASRVPLRGRGDIQETSGLLESESSLAFQGAALAGDGGRFSVKRKGDSAACNTNTSKAPRVTPAL